MIYTSSYFRDSLPDWKRKKDGTVCRYIYRPISFYITSFCANNQIKPNSVSYFSIGVALLGCALFYVDHYWAPIIASLVFMFWAVLDCVDGNLSRNVKAQPYGDFADSVSSYILVALLGVCVGYAANINGGMLFQKGSICPLIIGALGSIGDTLMRLTYHKYNAVTADLINRGYIEKGVDVRQDHSKVTSIQVRVETELGLDSLLLVVLLITSIFNVLDLAAIYIFLYYGGACLVMISKYIKKAIRNTDIIETKLKYQSNE